MGGGSKVCFLILLREFNKFEFFKDWGGGGSRPPTTPAHEHGYINKSREICLRTFGIMHQKIS